MNRTTTLPSPRPRSAPARSFIASVLAAAGALVSLAAPCAAQQTYTLVAVNVTDVTNSNLRSMRVPPGYSSGLTAIPGTYEGSGLRCDSTGCWWSVSDNGWVTKTSECGAQVCAKNLHFIREIADISRGNPAVVTTTGAHRWVTGDSVALYSTGFASVNGVRTITVINNTRFSLNGVNSSRESSAYNASRRPGRASFDASYQRSAIGAINFEGIEVHPLLGNYGWLLEERSSDSFIHEVNLVDQEGQTGNTSLLGHFSRSIDISGIVGDSLGNNGPEGICFVPNGADCGEEPGIFFIARQRGACIYRVKVDVDDHSSTAITNLPNSPFTPMAGLGDIGDIFYKDGVLWISYDAHDTIAAFRCDGSSNVSLIHEWQTRQVADGYPYVTAEGLYLDDNNLVISQDGPTGGLNGNALVKYPMWRHGTVLPAMMTAVSGKPAVFVAEPEPGWAVDSWYVDGTRHTGANSTEFSIMPTRNHTVTVKFRPEG